MSNFKMSEIIRFSGHISSFRNNFRGDQRNFSHYLHLVCDLVCDSIKMKIIL